MLQSFVPARDAVAANFSEPDVRLLSAPFTTNDRYSLKYEINGNKSQMAVNLKMGGNQIAVGQQDDGSDITFEITRVESMRDKKSLRYDLLGNSVQVDDALGDQSTLRYDGLGRLVEMTGPNDDRISFRYDSNDRLVWMEDPTGVTQYAYDALGRTTQITLPNGRGFVGYNHDLAGRVTSIGYPDGSSVGYSYDAAGRLEVVSQDQDSTRYEYYPDGLLKTVMLPNSILSTYLYDGFARLTDLIYTDKSQSLVMSFHYTMDDNGSRTAVEIRRPNAETPDPEDFSSEVFQYSYDSLDRLVQEDHPNGMLVTYSYDANGNRLNMNRFLDGEIDSKNYHYRTENRLDKITDAGGTMLCQYFYDPRGNRVMSVTSEETTRYFYDFRNLLTRVEKGRDVTEFEYDGNGERTSKSVNGKRIAYVNNPNSRVSQVLMVVEESGAVVSSYVHGLSRISADMVGESRAYFIHDALASTIALTDQLGRTVKSYRYDAFGLPELLEKSADRSNDNEYLFAGEHLDPHAGLIFLRSRYLDPEVGRYLTKDPSGFKDGPNLYVYVHNNPINLTDPLGLDALDDFYDDLRSVSVDYGLGANPGVGFIGGRVGYEYYQNGEVREVRRIGQDLPILPTPAGIVLAGYRLNSETGTIAPRISFTGVQGTISASLGPRVRIGYSSPGPAGARLGVSIPNRLLNPLTAVNVSSAVVNRIADRIGPSIANSFGTLQQNFLNGGRFLFDRIDNFLFSPAYADGIPSIGTGPSIQYSASRIGTDSLSSQFSAGSALNRGGILLNQAVGFVNDLSSITGATVDPETGQVVLIGVKDASGTIPEVRLDDFVTAVRAVYGSAENPGVTIDPEPGFENNPGRAQMVHLFAGLEDTDLGWVLVEADRVMKTLAAEKDNVSGLPVWSSVPGYKSMLQRWVEAQIAGDESIRYSRFWFVPSDVQLVRSDDNKSFVFDRTAVQLLTESTFLGETVNDSDAEAFADWFTRNFDLVSQEEFMVYDYPHDGIGDEVPRFTRIFTRLEQVAKAIAFARFLYDHRIPVDFSWIEDYELPVVNTPRLVRTVSNTRTIAGQQKTITITGGVILDKENSYLPDAGIAELLGSTAQNSRPDELTQGWEFDFPLADQQAKPVGLRQANTAVDAYNAAALSLKSQHVDGLRSRVDSDLSYQTPGDFPLELTRYYLSSSQSDGAFGVGWEFSPYAIDFTRPEFLSSSRSVYTFLNGLHEGELRIIDRRNGRVLTFGSSLETDRNGDQFVYNENGLVNGVPRYTPGGGEDPNGSILEQAPGNLEYTLSRPDGSRIQFDCKGRLLQVVDSRDRAVTYSYANGVVESISDSVGQTITLNRGDDGRVIQATGIGGDIVNYSYNSSGCLESATRTRQDERISYAYDYDEDRNLTVVTLPDKLLDGVSEFDIMGRITMQRDVRGNESHNSFDPLSRRTVTTALSSGQTVVQETDSLGRPTCLIDQLGRETRYIYFGLNREPNIIELPDPNRPPIRLKYDAHGNLAEIADPVRGGDLDRDFRDDSPISLSYDPNNNLVKVTDAKGIITQFSYNEFNQRTSMTRAVGTALEATTSWQYDSKSGFLTFQVGPTGVVTEFGYDALGNLIQRTTAPGTEAETTVRFAYDAFSRRTEQTDGAGRVTRYAFNGQDQITSVVLEGAKRLVLSRDYDPETRRLWRESDPNGNATLYTYDSVTGDLLEVSESRTTTAFSYDRFGNLASIRDPIGNFTHFSFDDLGRQTGRESLGKISVAGITFEGNRVQLILHAPDISSSIIIERNSDISAASWSAVSGVEFGNPMQGVITASFEKSGFQEYYRFGVRLGE